MNQTRTKLQGRAELQARSGSELRAEASRGWSDLGQAGSSGEATELLDAAWAVPLGLRAVSAVASGCVSGAYGWTSRGDGFAAPPIDTKC